MIFHFLLAVHLAAGIQEFLVVVFSDQFLKFRGGQPVLGQVANIQAYSALLEEAARFTTC